MVFIGNLKNMKVSSWGHVLSDPPSRRLCFCSFLPAAALLFILFFIGNAFVTFDYKEKVSTWEPTKSILTTNHNLCKGKGKSSASGPLPKGIVSRTSNLEMQPLWGSPHSPKQKGQRNPSKSLLAIAVGIKRKEIVNQIVKKFSSSDFIVMLFHYDGIVGEWRDLEWSDKALHISAINQTKWWFAKRFLHPDIVHEYDYIFLWDEDLDVEHFNPIRWVEIMAPVFSSAAWRCAWHMIQNDLIHVWGLDMKLGYCAQGDRSKKVGVVDSEYIGHLGFPTLGGLDESKARHQSYVELEIFRKRWQRAAAEDECWADPYQEPTEQARR